MTPALAGVTALTPQGMTHMLRPPVGEAVEVPIVVGAERHEHARPVRLRVWQAPEADDDIVVDVVESVRVVVDMPGVSVVGSGPDSPGVEGVVGIVDDFGMPGIAGVSGVVGVVGVVDGRGVAGVVVVVVVEGVVGVGVCASDSGAAAARKSAVASTKDRVMEMLRNLPRRQSIASEQQCARVTCGFPRACVLS